MKRILSIIAFSIAVVSCYDDSDLQNQLSNTKQDIVDLEDRVKDLEDWQASVNTQIKNLQDLVEKGEEGKVITNVQETTEGYAITFSDESVITIKHGAAGTNGTNGADGQTPAIGIKADEDGTYYWTINGEWLYAADAKVKAQGVDGVTPKLQISGGEWQVSYDNGSTWEGLGVYVTDGDTPVVSGGSCFFKSVTPSATEVVFELQDGEKFTIPVVAASANLLLNFGENTSLAVIPGESAELLFTVTGAEGAVSVEYMVSDEWVADLEMTADAAGKFTITAPATFVAGKLIVFATDASGKVTMKTITLVEGQPVVEDNIIFKDDFSWAEGKVLCNATSGEKRWDSYTGAGRPEWSTTVFTGAGTEDTPTPALWMRSGYVRANYAKKPGNLVTPKLSEIEGSADLTVTFRACRYQTSNGPDGYHEIHVACIGGGQTSVEMISVDNCNNMSEEDASWNTLDESVYTFNVTGATADTRIEFHFGPRREAADYNVNITAIPEGEANENCRMGFDDVVIKLAK